MRHDDLVAGQRDERPSRNRPLIDKGDGHGFGVEDGVADHSGRIDAPAKGVDLKDDRVGLGFVGVGDHALDKGRHARVDHTL